MSHVRATVRPVVTLEQAAACLLVLVLALPAACAGRKPPKQAQGPALTVSSEYVQLLRRHRPDLAERWAAPVPDEVPFEPLDINSVAGHEQSLRALLDRARALPASADADSLRARLTFELGQTGPGGALRTDPLLWLAIVEAAARVPFAYDSTPGCREVERGMRQFERIPEALRGAAVLMSGAPPPDPVAFEAGLTRVEWVFRHDLPGRTKACKEGRLLAGFVEADTLAAASLAGFRRLLVSGP